jgi:hypothetical protein
MLSHEPCRSKLPDKCRPSPALEGDDGLDLRVAALPPLFTSRFGEVVFAQGGAGYGMWPCYIYDPRMTVGGARELAKKNLGKKHLVYFFQCHEAPFAALPDSKIVEWYTGLTENYHLGRAAKHTGKNRALQFAEALKIANLELGKPIEHRMDWNHPDPTLASPVKEEILQSPLGKKRRRPPRSRKKHHHKHHHSEEKHDFLVDDRDVVRVPKRLCTAKKCVRTNLEMTLTIHNESASDEAVLFLRVVLRKGLDDTTIPVGFVSFGSRQESTFAEARETIERDVDPSILNEDDWRFYIPELGPVSLRQETSLGPLLPFLQKVSEDPLLGDGTIRKPIKVVLAKNKEINPSLVP